MDFLSNLSVADFFGYFASVFIIGAFLSHNVLRIRIINAIGCLCFVIFGVMTEAWPVVIPNGLLFFVQLYYIFFKQNKAS